MAARQFVAGRFGSLPRGRLSRRNPFGPSEEEVRANVAGEASADAAIALQAAAREEAAAAAREEAARDEQDPGTDEPAELDAPRDLTAAAFFDVDNTLVQGASIVHFARGLAARKYLRTADLVDFAWKQVKFRVTGRENSDDVASGKEKALSFIAGRSTAQLAQLGEEIYDEIIADKIWPGTRALAQMHLDAGQQVWLVTATPVELAQVIAKRLGFTGALGTVAESEDGVFTGRLVGDILHGLGKAHAVRTLAIREGLNLRRCTAYSDSHNDVPMLSLVGTAVAINPDSDLREVAKNRGWEMRDFRTGRKAARIGVPTALVIGTVGGAVAAGLTRRRAAVVAG
ncbi:HAD-IB family hydrolase [Skermania piniformis]|uniref:HAD-IB family hydrolase n=1 Tax=Skermania pinensis TaxID=39122 RepID=A0ABX8SCN5_9ACTN|nr:HAD-IB family hydrolase [Skermania piniformis]